MDPLLALRNAVKSKYQVQLPPKGQDYPLQLSSTASFPLSTPTRLRKPGENRHNDSIHPSSHPQDFYTLEAVAFAWAERDASAADYMRRAGERGLLGNVIGVAERRGYLEWLEGRNNVLDGLLALIEESTTPPGTPPRHAASFVSSTISTTPGKTQSSSAYGQSHGATASPAKRRYVPDSLDLEVVKKIRQNEAELRDRNSVLRGNKVNNFSSIQKLYSEKLKKAREASKSGSATTAPVPSTAISAKSDPKNLARKARNMHPIIIISSSPTSLITMHNVKMFFQDAMFEPPATARARSASEGNSARGEDVIPIYRKRDIDPFAQHDSQSSQIRNTQKTYFVVDGVDALQKFGADAWDRVVAVLTTGQAWQFKQYKYNEPKSLFHHVKGFYVSWSNDPPNQKIKDWNVSELKIDPNRRHVDKSVVAHFWRTLDTWMLANKPWLMKS